MWPELSDELLKQAVNLVKEHGGVSQASTASGIARTTLAHRYKRAVDKGLCGYVPKPLPPGQRLRGVSTLYDKDGNEKLTWVKTKNDIDYTQVITAARDVFEEYEGKAEPCEAPTDADENLLSVYIIADQHIGLMCWGEETGDSYDLKIGVERLRSSMQRLMQQSPSSAKALILNLGDFYHADDRRNMTPQSGHILDVDGRYTKVLKAGVQLMMDCIDLALAKHEEVIVRNLPGNHDPHASVALTVALAAFYSRESRIVIDEDPGDFFFYRFGSTLIGANHGHKAKPVDMAFSMAERRKEDWGTTDFHYFYHGHIHKVHAEEVGGVIVESFRTIASKDAYAHSMGYNSGMSLESITHHVRDGEIGRHRVNILGGRK